MTLTILTPGLEIAYEAHGDPRGFPVVLLHGFPDDVRAWDGVAPALAAAGCRALVPYLRGYGRTRFLDPGGPRMAQQAAIGQDLLDFVDVRALVTIGGYNVQNTTAPSRPASAAEERARWYQWYFNTERGRRGLEQNRREICRLLWREWSPSWGFDDATFDRTAQSFDSPDFVEVVIHSYRHRHGNASGEERFDALDGRLAERPPITAPTTVLHGAEDTVDPARHSERHMPLFPAGTERRVVPGGGHFLPREQPGAVAEAILALLARTG